MGNGKWEMGNGKLKMPSIVLFPQLTAFLISNLLFFNRAIVPRSMVFLISNFPFLIQQDLQSY